jgi:redox-sensitive bicupin YhaK (pirin superfamily)
MVGPFIFFDAMGPEILAPGRGLDVAPHPHIGIATLTYLFAGEMIHRDGLGTIQTIRPGDVNWMTAGSGLAHSERTSNGLRETGSEMFGIQSWIALPARYEEITPSFSHYESGDLPVVEGEGVTARIIAGSLFGRESRVSTFSETVYADISLKAGSILRIDARYEERAIYIVNGGLEIDSISYHAHQLLILKPGEQIILKSLQDDARFMLLGGEPLEGKRFIWWNFVSSSPERIDQAKLDWREGRFAPVPGETESIPLPRESRPAPVRYP